MLIYIILTRVRIALICKILTDTGIEMGQPKNAKGNDKAVDYGSMIASDLAVSLSLA